MHDNEKFAFADNRSEAAGSSRVSGRDSGDCRIIINVGGHRHETHLSTLRNFPGTRLHWMVESPLTKIYNSATDQGNPLEYFFDRHPGVFTHVLNYYRTGKLHCPADVCGAMFEEELIFWGIDELQMEPCCWSTYTRHRDAQAFEKVFTVNTSREEGESEEKEEGEGSETASVNETTLCDSYKATLWGMLEKPYSSKKAQVLAFLSLSVIITSVVSFCLESMQALQTYQNIFRALEYIYCALFTLDLTARLYSCPNRLKFFRSTITWCDIVSLLPFYSDIIWKEDYLDVFLVLRLLRIFRLFRFFRFMSGMQVIGHTLKASARELFLLVLILLIPMVIFSSLLFYTEKAFGGDTKFDSIPDSFWWAVITMTTVGYGDMYPQTALGRLIGTMCACSGVLIVALPVSVIGSNFSLFYSHAQAQLKLPRKRKQPALVGAASALMSNVAPEIGSCSGSETESASDSALEEKIAVNKQVLNHTESTKDIQVVVEDSETYAQSKEHAHDLVEEDSEKYVQVEVEGSASDIQMGKDLKGTESSKDVRVELNTSRKYGKFSWLLKKTSSSRSLNKRDKTRGNSSSTGMELGEGLKRLGDVMVNIAAPQQRRMAISGVSLDSPSLRRSSSGKRRSRPKSGESMRKRAYTSGSDACRSDGFDDLCQFTNANPTESNTENETDQNNELFRSISPKPTPESFLAKNNTMISKGTASSAVLVARDKENNRDRPQSKNSKDSSDVSSPEIQPLLHNNPQDLTSHQSLMLYITHASSIQNIDNLQTIENSKNPKGYSRRALTPEFIDTPRVMDYNKLTPWYDKTNRKEKNADFTRFGRRRSSTINICNV